MRTDGRHIIAELSGCRADLLESIPQIRGIMADAAVAAGAKVLGVSAHKFSPQGISCIVVIAESHLSIHTWPETGYAALDIYTCGDDTDPKAACMHVCRCLEAQDIFQSEISRGLSNSGRRFGHSISTKNLSVRSLVAAQA